MLDPGLATSAYGSLLGAPATDSLGKSGKGRTAVPGEVSKRRSDSNCECPAPKLGPSRDKVFPCQADHTPRCGICFTYIIPLVKC